jgi:hypothetical protein
MYLYILFLRTQIILLQNKETSGYQPYLNSMKSGNSSLTGEHLLGSYQDCAGNRHLQYFHTSLWETWQAMRSPPLSRRGDW